MTDEPTTLDHLMSAVTNAVGTIEAITEMSDSLTFDEAHMAAQAIGDLSSAIKTANAMLVSRRDALIRAAGSGGLRSGDLLYALKPDGKWRPNWRDVLDKVTNRAYVLDTESGEMLTPEEAVSNAVIIMRELFLSDSSVPKVGAVRSLLGGKGLDLICHWERTGEKLEVLDLSSPE